MTPREYLNSRNDSLVEDIDGLAELAGYSEEDHNQGKTEDLCYDPSGYYGASGEKSRT